MRTPQQALDFLVEQGALGRFPSMDVNNRRCMYRGDRSNSACGIGCMIPDALYDKGMEGKSVTSLVDAFPDVVAHVSIEGGRNIHLLEIQQLHDNMAQDLDDKWDQSRWVTGLMGLWIFKGLTPSVSPVTEVHCCG